MRIIASTLLGLVAGCSAFNPRMSPPIRSAYEEWDRETDETVYYGEIHEMRCRNGAIEMRTFNMATHAPDEWRRVDPGHDWNVWVARWAWEGAKKPK